MSASRRRNVRRSRSAAGGGSAGFAASTPGCVGIVMLGTGAPRRARGTLIARSRPTAPEIHAQGRILTGLTGRPQDRFNGDPHDAAVDDLVGRSGGTATAELEPRPGGVAHATP